jgi:Carboxypeptidase regulatory-like domain
VTLNILSGGYVPGKVTTKLSVVFLISFSFSAFAQSNYAVLNGNVSDPKGGVVPGAAIQVTAANTGAVRQVVTNGQGLFDIPGLVPDAYTLQVTAPGFAVLTQSLKLEVAQRLTVGLNLRLASVPQSVNVAAKAEELRTTDASLGEVVESKAVQSLPLNGRMLIDLVLTVPGAASSPER